MKIAISNIKLDYFTLKSNQYSFPQNKSCVGHLNPSAPWSQLW